MTVRCISLHQPWATLLAHGKKRVETRGWAFRGPLPCVLAVHAAKNFLGGLSADHVAGYVALCQSPHYAEALTECGHATAGDVPRGGVVGLVLLHSCVSTEAIHAFRREWLTPRELAFGDFSAGRFGWVCDRSHAFATPIPLRGQQGVFSWDAPAAAVAVANEWLSATGGLTDARD